MHFLLDRFQVAFANRLHGKIVVESTIDGRPDGWLRIRIEFHDRLCQQVRSTVTKNVNAFITLCKNAFDMAIIG